MSASRHAIFRHSIIWLTLMATMTLSLLVASCSGSQAPGQAAVTQSLPITSTSSAFSISLTDIASTTNQISVTFRLEDQDPATPPRIEDYVPLAPTDIEVEGLSRADLNPGRVRALLDNTKATVPSAVVAMEQIFDFTLTQTHDMPVSIVITRLTFSSLSPGTPSVQVAGKWAFSFIPAEFSVIPSSRLPIDKSIQSKGITFKVNEVVFNALWARVVYSVTSSSPVELETTGLIAILPDGNFMHPSAIQHNDDQHEAVFDAFPDGAVTLALMPLMVEIPKPASMHISLDSSIQEGDEVGSSIATQSVATIGGEQLSVEQVTIEKDMFSIRVNNAMPHHSGHVLLRYPNTSSAVLTDNFGKAYPMVHATTNFGKSGPLDMWADGSTFSFAGSLPMEVTDLTLRVENYGLLVDGPWEIVLEVPKPEQ